MHSIKTHTVVAPIQRTRDSFDIVAHVRLRVFMFQKGLMLTFCIQELIDQNEFIQMYGGELKQGSKYCPPTEVITNLAKIIQ